MEIIGAENLDEDALALKLRNGYRLVSYQFCVSIIVLTFKRSSSVYLVPPGDSDIGNRMLYAAISFFFGWWGFPFGPIFTIMSLFNVLSGGTDHSSDFMQALIEQVDRAEHVEPTTAAPRNNSGTPGMAVAAIALGLVGLIGLGPLASIPAIICGHLALNQMRRTGNSNGKGLAIAGLVLGYLVTLFMIVAVAVIVLAAAQG